MYEKSGEYLKDSSLIVQRPGANNVYLVPSKYLVNNYVYILFFNLLHF
jgi:hypothetical protein